MKPILSDEFDSAAPSPWRLVLRRTVPAAFYAAYAAAAALTIGGSVSPEDAFLVLSGTAAIAIVAIALGFRRHYIWAHSNCEDLDEREQRVRARAYEAAYGMVILAGILFFAPPLLIEALADAPNRNEMLKAAVFGFLLLASTLPTVVLAWRDRGDAQGGAGITGRLSRRTMVFWAVCGSIGLVAGFALGYYA